MPKKSARQRSSWKTHQRDHKVKRKTKLALTVLGILIGILLLAQLVNFIKVLAEPYSLLKTDKKYTWDRNFNVNFLVGTKNISLVTYKPEEKQILVLKIPDETYIDLSDDFGKWQLRSIYELGEGSEIGGEALLKRSLSYFLGLPIDGYSSENLSDLYRKNFFSGITDLPNLKTDFTPWELLHLKLSFLKVRFDKIKEINLEDLIVLDKQKLADGTDVFIADPIRLDSIMQEFSDTKIFEEHASVAIFNATNRPNLAQKVKRMITNLGGNVIVTQNAPWSVAKSYIDPGSTGVEGEDLKTKKRLEQIFDLGCSKDPNCAKIPKEDLGLASQRSQIIVVLGEDFP